MKKFYVDENDQARIICHKCGINKNLDVTKFKDTHKKLKAKCKCGENFRLNLDFRRHYRKKVQLSGECFIQEKGERDDILIIDVRYCQMLCTALGSDPVYFDTVNKLYSFNYHC